MRPQGPDAPTIALMFEEVAVEASAAGADGTRRLRRPEDAEASEGWASGLDDAQLTAATHGDEPLVIVAGAGTGKTRTLTSRVAHLLERGTAPERILLLTFTRRAADDMLARAAALARVPRAGPRRPAGRLWGGTFHAVAHRFVAMHAESLGLPSRFSVLDQADAADVMDLLREECGLDPGERGGPGAEAGDSPGGPATANHSHRPAAAPGHPRRRLLPLREHPPAAA